MCRTRLRCSCHAGFRIDFEFLGIHGRPEVGVVLSCIFAFAVAFRVVDMLSRKINSQTFSSDLEFASRIAMCQKAKSHAQVDDRL